MLAGAGALQAEGAADQFVVQRFGGGALFGAVGVDQVAKVEVAIAHMAHQEVGDAAGIGFGHRVEQAVGQSADGHTGVGADAAAARTGLHRSEVRVVTRRPQAGALFRGGGPFKRLATVVRGNRLHCFGLLFHAGRRAMELHQQQGLLFQRELGIVVDQAHAVHIDQFHARNRHAQLNRLNRGVNRRLQRGEGADCGRHRLRQGVQFHRDFGDHAQRAFAAHKQARQVIARAGFFGA